MSRVERLLPWLTACLVGGTVVVAAMAGSQERTGAVGARAHAAEPASGPVVAPAATDEPTAQFFLQLPLILHGELPVAPRFALQVIPPRITNSVPGQRCVFLVVVHDNTTPVSDLPVTLTASAPGATVSVEPASARPGTVAEVTVIPDAATQEQTLPVTIHGQRGTETTTAVANLDVLTDMPDLEPERGTTAAEMLQPFLPWLAEHHPELGITPDTQWWRTVVTPQILVVMHYLFFSAEWEVHIEWHVMIPPHDWTRIDLRHRFDETRPSRAFEISSRGNQTEPIEIDPPESIWR